MWSAIKFDSIKTRLLIIISVCLTGMLVLVMNQIVNTSSLVSLHNQNKQLLQLSNALLQLRRHEKDFLLRHDPEYVSRFEQRAASFNDTILRIKPHYTDMQDARILFEQLEESLRHYQQGFSQLVTLQTELGLDENSGYQGAFREATHRLEEVFTRHNQTELQVLLLQMRRSEKDFLLRKRLTYVEREAQLYQQLFQAIRQSSELNQTELLTLLKQYQQGFLQLVAGHQQIGLEPTLGLRGQFRQQAHGLESQLESLNSKLGVMIDDAEQRVERNSLVIMLVTAGALIILLVKSYITFQRAFLNFVMFFYRCKREYQHMDGKKLGFSEFKYLATIANEMIDARRDIERQLQAANKQIAKLEQQG